MPDTSTKISPLGIIGAGLAGSTLASEYKSPSLVFEKGRGTGGRMATRRTSQGVFNHGFQEFKSEDFGNPLFKAFLEEQLRKGILKQQSETSISSESLIVTEGSSKFVKLFKLDKANLHHGRVVELKRHSGNWQIQLESGLSFSTEKLAISAPIPQACELISDSGLELDKDLPKVDYERCLVLMVSIEDPESHKTLKETCLASSDILCFSDNLESSISDLPCYTLQFRDSISCKFWEHPHWDKREEESLREDLLRTLSREIGLNPKDSGIGLVSTHRWKFSQAKNPCEAPFYKSNTNPGLYLFGDAFSGGGVQGAWLSGMALAEELQLKTT